MWTLGCTVSVCALVHRSRLLKPWSLQGASKSSCALMRRLVSRARDGGRVGLLPRKTRHGLRAGLSTCHPCWDFQRGEGLHGGPGPTASELTTVTPL